MAFYTEKEKYFKKDVLSYHTCKDIYRTSVMGKRVVEALVNFSMSAERDISIQKAPPEAVEHFKYIAKQLRQNESIKKTIYNARIYGTGALFVALHNIAEDKDDFTTKPNFNDAENYDIRFNVLDPQNIASSTFDSNPASFHFLELIDIKVDNQLIPRKRIAISHALEPLYLDNRTSLIPYSPPSVFYNMIDLLKDYDQAIESLDNLLYKAGAIIYKYKAGGKFSGIQLDAIKRSSEILEQKRNGAVISIDNQCEIQDFPINNVNGLIESVNKLEDAITKALNDTPASLLFDKSLSNGFSEGDKDKETEISIIEAFRENKLTPLYTLTDYYVMLKAFDNDFINEMKDKYSDLKDKSNTEIFYEWCNSFKYEFGNLFPEPESKTIENNSKKLDNLIKLQQLGANAADIEAELNEDEIFKNEMDLDGQEPNFDIDNDNDIDATSGQMPNIDANMLRIDDSDVPAGFEWKTLPNGEHVLINSSTGEIVSGAGIQDWKDTGKMTVPEPAPQPKPEPKVLNNKEWRALEEKIADAEDDVEFYTKALEGAENERQVAAINRNINEAKERAAKLKEEMANSKKAGINAEKDKDKTKNSKKKITKNYSISYDNETIDKLKSLGKVWQDKRIYFKELDNGYYDLENEKWVTDSPALTEKALTIAGETTEEKTARLENERIAEEQRKEAERIAKETAKKERQAREKPIAMRVYDKLRDCKTFDNQIFKAMNEAGIFEEFSIPKGSINAITDKLFTEEEQDAWKGIDKSDSDFSKLNDTYKYWQSHPLDNLKDFIFENVKSELNHINDMYKPMKWEDWLWQEKDLNNGSQSVNNLEDITDEDPDLIREYLNYKYIKNSVAWEKFGKEFEEYKKNYRKTASAKVREYIENKLSGMESGTGKVDSKVYIDNFVDNFIRFADIKIDAKEDLEWKTLKSNGEHVLVNGDDEVVSGAGGALSKDKDKQAKKNKDKSKDKSKDKAKSPQERSKDKSKKLKVNKVSKDNIYTNKMASQLLSDLYRGDYFLNPSSEKLIKDYIANLSKEDNPIANNIKNQLEEILDGKEINAYINKPSSSKIKKAIESLPETQRKTADYIYNIKPIAKELWKKHEHSEFKLEAGESTKGKIKRMVYSDLDNGARAMYGFSSIGEYDRYSKEEDAEIIDLIKNSPFERKTVYRGEQIDTNIIENLKAGLSYAEIKKGEVNSSNASYSMKTAWSFAQEEESEDYKCVVNVFENTQHINGFNVSYYSDEAECYIDKREQILDNIYIDERGYYYLIYKPKGD